MTKYFTTYWSKDTWQYHKKKMESIPIVHTASNLLIPNKRVRIGDHLYVVSVFSKSKGLKKLWLGTKITVAWMGSREEAIRKLNNRNLWEANYHVIGEYAEANPIFFDLDITRGYKNIEFINKDSFSNPQCDKKSEGLDIEAQQFRNLREVTKRTADFFDYELENAQSSRSFQGRITQLKHVQQDFWFDDYSEFFKCWLVLNGLYGDYIPTGKNSERNRIEAFCKDIKKNNIKLPGEFWKSSSDFLNVLDPENEDIQMNIEILEYRNELIHGCKNLFYLLRLIYHVRCILFHGDVTDISMRKRETYKNLILKSIPILKRIIDELRRIEF